MALLNGHKLTTKRPKYPKHIGGSRIWIVPSRKTLADLMRGISPWTSCVARLRCVVRPRMKRRWTWKSCWGPGSAWNLGRTGASNLSFFFGGFTGVITTIFVVLLLFLLWFPTIFCGIL